MLSIKKLENGNFKISGFDARRAGWSIGKTCKNQWKNKKEFIEKAGRAYPENIVKNALYGIPAFVVEEIVDSFINNGEGFTQKIKNDVVIVRPV